MASPKATTRRVTIPRGMSPPSAWTRNQCAVYGVQDKHRSVRGARIPEQRPKAPSSIRLGLLVQPVDERHRDHEDAAVAERAEEEREGLVAVAKVVVHHLRGHA